MPWLQRPRPWLANWMTRQGLERGASTAWLLLALVAVVLMLQCKGEREREREAAATPPAADSGARGACGLFIGRLARNPASVELINQPSWTTLHNADGTWSVLAHYRAQNGFGGMNVERSTCVMRKDAAGNWALITVSRMQ